MENNYYQKGTNILKRLIQDTRNIEGVYIEPILNNLVSQCQKNKITDDYFFGQAKKIDEEVNIDVTVKSEESSEHHEILDKIPESAAIVQRGILRQVNRPFMDLIGYEVDELVKKSLFDFIVPEGFSGIEEYYLNRLKGESVSSFETMFLTKDNIKLTVEVNLKPTVFNGEKAEIAVFNRVSDVQEVTTVGESEEKPVEQPVQEAVETSELPTEEPKEETQASEPEAPAEELPKEEEKPAEPIEEPAAEPETIEEQPKEETPEPETPVEEQELPKEEKPVESTEESQEPAAEPETVEEHPKGDTEPASSKEETVEAEIPKDEKPAESLEKTDTETESTDKSEDKAEGEKAKSKEAAEDSDEDKKAEKE